MKASSWLIDSLLQAPSHRGLGLQHMDLGGGSEAHSGNRSEAPHGALRESALSTGAL